MTARPPPNGASALAQADAVTPCRVAPREGGVELRELALVWVPTLGGDA